jgi:DNA (cytosine-5)-methyltransferase 1
MRYEYIDIFAGCGGLSLGLHNAGWKGMFAIEKNADAFSTLKYNLIDNKKHFSWKKWLDISNHDINEIIKESKNDLLSLNGEVTLVVGGPPCQGFSMAGQRDKDDERNKLVNSYIEFVKIIKPECVFFENVHGITVGFKDKNEKKSTPASKYIIEKLKKIGYNVESKIIDMYDYGVPQRRKRFILIAFLNKNPSIFFDILEKNKNSFLKSKNLTLKTNVSQAISDLSSNNNQIDCIDSKGFKAGTYGKASTKYQRYMRSGITKKAIPNSHRFANHKNTTVDLFKKIFEKCDRGKRLSPKNTNVINLKKRGVTILVDNQPCNTITSHPDDYIHYSEPRIMSVRECARIQSFPDWFEFKGKYTTGGELRKTDVPRYTQVGNAIPPLFSEQVGLALKEILKNATEKQT